MLAKQAQAKISFVQYPLAPECQHHQTIAHAVKANELLTHEFDDEFYVAGDSAGGGVATALLHELTGSGKNQPYKKLLLISPWLNPTSLDLVPEALQKRISYLVRLG